MKEERLKFANCLFMFLFGILGLLTVMKYL